MEKIDEIITKKKDRYLRIKSSILEKLFSFYSDYKVEEITKLFDEYLIVFMCLFLSLEYLMMMSLILLDSNSFIYDLNENYKEIKDLIVYIKDTFSIYTSMDSTKSFLLLLLIFSLNFLQLISIFLRSQIKKIRVLGKIYDFFENMIFWKILIFDNILVMSYFIVSFSGIKCSSDIDFLLKLNIAENPNYNNIIETNNDLSLSFLYYNVINLDYKYDDKVMIKNQDFFNKLINEKTITQYYVNFPFNYNKDFEIKGINECSNHTIVLIFSILTIIFTLINQVLNIYFLKEDSPRIHSINTNFCSKHGIAVLTLKLTLAFFFAFQTGNDVLIHIKHFIVFIEIIVILMIKKSILSYSNVNLYILESFFEGVWIISALVGILNKYISFTFDYDFIIICFVVSSISGLTFTYWIFKKQNDLFFLSDEELQENNMIDKLRLLFYFSYNFFHQKKSRVKFISKIREEIITSHTKYCKCCNYLDILIQINYLTDVNYVDLNNGSFNFNIEYLKSEKTESLIIEEVDDEEDSRKYISEESQSLYSSSLASIREIDLFNSKNVLGEDLAISRGNNETNNLNLRYRMPSKDKSSNSNTNINNLNLQYTNSNSPKNIEKLKSNSNKANNQLILSKQYNTNPNNIQINTYNLKNDIYVGDDANNYNNFDYYGSTKIPTEMIKEEIKRIDNNKILKDKTQAEKLTHSLYSILLCMINECKKKYPLNPILHIMYSKICLFYLNNYHLAIFELLKIKNNSTRSDYIVYKHYQSIMKIVNKEYSINHKEEDKQQINSDSVISYNKLIDCLETQFKLCSDETIKFWTIIMEKDKENYYKIFTYSKTIFDIKHQIKKIFDELLYKYSLQNVSIIKDYIGFWTTVILDSKAKFKIRKLIKQLKMDHYSILEKYNHDLFCDIDSLGVFMVGSNLSNLSKIEYINTIALNIIKYNKKDVLDCHLEILLPEYIGEFHDHYVRRYIETNKTNVLEKDKILVLRTKHGYIVPVYIHIKKMYSFSESIKFIAGCKRIKKPNCLVTPETQYGNYVFNTLNDPNTSYFSNNNTNSYLKGTPSIPLNSISNSNLNLYNLNNANISDNNANSDQNVLKNYTIISKDYTHSLQNLKGFGNNINNAKNNQHKKFDDYFNNSEIREDEVTPNNNVSSKSFQSNTHNTQNNDIPITPNSQTMLLSSESVSLIITTGPPEYYFIGLNKSAIAQFGIPPTVKYSKNQGKKVLKITDIFEDLFQIPTSIAKKSTEIVSGLLKTKDTAFKINEAVNNNMNKIIEMCYVNPSEIKYNDGIITYLNSVNLNSMYYDFVETVSEDGSSYFDLIQESIKKNIHAKHIVHLSYFNINYNPANSSFCIFRAVKIHPTQIKKKNLLQCVLKKKNLLKKNSNTNANTSSQNVNKSLMSNKNSSLHVNSYTTFENSVESNFTTFINNYNTGSNINSSNNVNKNLVKNSHNNTITSHANQANQGTEFSSQPFNSNAMQTIANSDNTTSIANTNINDVNNYNYNNNRNIYHKSKSFKELIYNTEDEEDTNKDIKISNTLNANKQTNFYMNKIENDNINNNTDIIRKEFFIKIAKSNIYMFKRSFLLVLPIIACFIAWSILRYSYLHKSQGYYKMKKLFLQRQQKYSLILTSVDFLYYLDNDYLNSNFNYDRTQLISDLKNIINTSTQLNYEIEMNNQLISFNKTLFSTHLKELEKLFSLKYNLYSFITDNYFDSIMNTTYSNSDANDDVLTNEELIKIIISQNDSLISEDNYYIKYYEIAFSQILDSIIVKISNLLLDTDSFSLYNLTDLIIKLNYANDSSLRDTYKHQIRINDELITGYHYINENYIFSILKNLETISGYLISEVLRDNYFDTTVLIIETAPFLILLIILFMHFYIIGKIFITKKKFLSLFLMTEKNFIKSIIENCLYYSSNLSASKLLMQETGNLNISKSFINKKQSPSKIKNKTHKLNKKLSDNSDYNTKFQENNQIKNTIRKSKERVSFVVGTNSNNMPNSNYSPHTALIKSRFFQGTEIKNANEDLINNYSKEYNLRKKSDPTNNAIEKKTSFMLDEYEINPNDRNNLKANKQKFKRLNSNILRGSNTDMSANSNFSNNVNSNENINNEQSLRQLNYFNNNTENVSHSNKTIGNNNTSNNQISSNNTSNNTSNNLNNYLNSNNMIKENYGYNLNKNKNNLNTNNSNKISYINNINNTDNTKNIEGLNNHIRKIKKDEDDSEFNLLNKRDNVKSHLALLNEDISESSKISSRSKKSRRFKSKQTKQPDNFMTYIDNITSNLTNVDHVNDIKKTHLKSNSNNNFKDLVNSKISTNSILRKSHSINKTDTPLKDTSKASVFLKEHIKNTAKTYMRDPTSVNKKEINKTHSNLNIVRPTKDTKSSQNVISSKNRHSLDQEEELELWEQEENIFFLKYDEISSEPKINSYLLKDVNSIIYKIILLLLFLSFFFVVMILIERDYFNYEKTLHISPITFRLWSINNYFFITSYLLSHNLINKCSPKTNASLKLFSEYEELKKYLGVSYSNISSNSLLIANETIDFAPAYCETYSYFYNQIYKIENDILLMNSNSNGILKDYLELNTRLNQGSEFCTELPKLAQESNTTALIDDNFKENCDTFFANSTLGLNDQISLIWKYFQINFDSNSTLSDNESEFISNEDSDTETNLSLDDYYYSRLFVLLKDYINPALTILIEETYDSLLDFSNNEENKLTIIVIAFGLFIICESMYAFCIIKEFENSIQKNEAFYDMLPNQEKINNKLYLLYDEGN